MRKRQRPDLLAHLHEHQRAAVFDIIGELRGHRSTLLAWSTGTGKTHVSLGWLAEEMRPDDRALILAHRRELIYQPVERIKQFFPSLHPAGIVMAERNDVAAPVIVATVQSLNSGNRLNDIILHGSITHLITDECHHSCSDTYERIYARLFEANPDMKHLGVTATPRRADDVSLKDVFETVADRLSINDAIAMKALVPLLVQGFYVETVSIGHLAQSGEDWSDKAVGEVMSEKAILDTAVAKWQEHAAGRPTIAFCATVAQAHRTAMWFRNAGVSAEAADYLTTGEMRAGILERFKRCETTVICNMGLWTEGVDLPNAEVALMLRPTRSDSLYIQMAGRVLRTFPPHKKSALILDLIPADARNMVMGGDLLAGKPKAQKKAEDKALDKGVMLSCFGIDKDGQGIDGEPDQVIMRVLDYLTASTLAWTSPGDGIATVGLSDTKTLIVVLPDADRVADAEKYRDTPQWNDACERELERISAHRVFAIVQYKDPVTGKRGAKSVRALGTFDSWDDTIATTEDYAAEHAVSTLAKRAKRWRKSLPTDKQIKYARRLRRPALGDKDPATMLRGELAQFITHRAAYSKLERDRLLWPKRA